MLTDIRAANMAEYAIIMVLVLLAAVAAFSGLGKRIVDAVNRVTLQ